MGCAFLFSNAKVWNGVDFSAPEYLYVNEGRIIYQGAVEPINLEGRVRKINLARGYIIPGIVDIHTHADFTAISPIATENALMQGVTRQVAGLCGFHPVYSETVATEDYLRYTAFLGDPKMLKHSWDAFFEQINTIEPVKRYMLYGINSFLFSHPILDEDDIDNRVEQCIEEYRKHPFYGFSLSLNYHPVKSLPAKWLHQFMRKLLARLPVTCCYHVRNQKEDILPSIREVMSWHVGTQARCHISHLKFGGNTHRGRFPERYKTLCAYRAQADFPLSWDTYPFAFASSTITSLFPTTDFWKENSIAEVYQWLKDNPPTSLEAIRIQCDDKRYSGQQIKQITNMLREDCLMALIHICHELGGLGTYQRDFCCEEDLNWLLEQPDVFIASDSFGLDHLHPRNTQTFTRVLIRAIEQGEQTLCAEVKRLQLGVKTVFPHIPMPLIAVGEIAELFFFTTELNQSQDAFECSGTLIGEQLHITQQEQAQYERGQKTIETTF
ncbi:hypothetical protein [Plesiomonas shigelloides]|uniref:hypothetical protein n=1 Tax=Plesiomonas shigelloides TaxID=703 RepID=UPI003EBD8C4D